MQIADLQLHSKYSRATSGKMVLDELAKYAKIKGVDILGTGDFTHPIWLQELKGKLAEKNAGVYEYDDVMFVLTGEISLIYTQDGRQRRVHHVILAPNFSVVDQINEWLDKKGRRDYDGRPIFGFSSIEFVEAMMSISKDIEIIPAHCWTPWYGIFGSMSGFDSLEECFREKAKYIHCIETGMSCYDTETEVLTNNGWKKISSVGHSDEICTLDINTNRIELQKPIKLFKYSYKGKMYRLKTKRIDLLVTPNHKLLCSPCDFRKNPSFSLKEAEFLFNKSKRFKKDGIWIGDNPEYFVIPAVKIKHGSRFYSGFRNKGEKKCPIKPWLRFFGFWLAEGWATESKNGDYGIYLANSNPEIISEMKKILESFDYTVYQYKNRSMDTIRVRDYQLFSYLKQFGKASEKFIPSDIKSLSKEFLEILFEFYIKGDGHRYGRNGKGLSATTISKRLRDDLQEIALKIGISAYYKLHNKKGTPITSLPKAKLKGYKQSEDSWVIYFIRNNIHTVLPSTIKKYNYIESWVDYDGFVYCVEVPNHVIYIRRNGIPVWCGNSNPAMNWRISALDNITLTSNSDAHSPYPWRLGREANVFDFKEVNFENIINAFRNRKDFAYTIETSPNYGKYHYDGHRACNFSCSPDETKKLSDVCPKCGKKLVIGVLNRVEQLADRDEGFVPKDAIPFRTLIPLSEVIAAFHDTDVFTKKVWEIYNRLIDRFGDEFNILLNTEKNELEKTIDEKLAALIIKNRENKLHVEPGYDGVYGKLVVKEETGLRRFIK